MDMSFQKEHINCFVVASGDSDFSPLVSKLKENNKYVIGLGVKNSTSDLLIENCDEFIFYEDLVRGHQRPLPVIANVPEKVQECFSLLVDSILALQRENKEVLWGSMVKETMKRKKPSFNETYYGFRTFSHLLEDAQRRGIVVLRRDQRSGSYVVEDLGTASSTARMEPPAAPAPVAVPAQKAPEPTTAAAGANGHAPDADSGARGTRRRRGRGRRPAGASTLAAGAYSEPTGAATTDDGADGEEDGSSAEEHDRAGSPEAGESHASAERHPSGPPAAEPERPAFSLFSWIRRETARPAHEAAENEEAKPDAPESRSASGSER
jgi:hypothetical protein